MASWRARCKYQWPCFLHRIPDLGATPFSAGLLAGTTKLRKIMHLLVAPVCLPANMHSSPPFTHPFPLKENRI
ncbi:unnamed protein product [Nyctereutes procyonoides]|uniref:(raccoon dog) hypothetical protein n=1 Tax=Nyctereutes procyonoides TaxID=34880 RepID=A0A811Z372_NYCPR|nr:unnamed protein product [Nyctereutes procyonoides]